MKESNELFQALTKVVRYLSFDKNVREETQFLRKVCEGQVEDGARGLEFGSSVSSETFCHLVKDWKTLVKAVQEYQEVLKANNIGVENNERQRIEQSARRVGLEVPIGFDNDKESDFKKD
ncbi:uncharacterized protein Gasu_22980 [Galdieria sulphuraria]|uniref:Uncharacterized protein n=1 Tax=Galdieria sulphuraria TaxID=130081 RepID=M2W3U8_GALSU|nr:uncharacterized protein Gasu_22980 [Galdieria sulphuraria]EME30391.1 hypothetical protein Gasu_22980 [Galdieria sulphuraria]|eukprot:XP_005706911.1 hypothetical protein Gasu_22980 [Galdieria sulphuraria]